MTRLRVRWAENASLDLVEIIEYIAQDQPAAARKIGRALLSSASRLAVHPYRGKLVPELHEQGISNYRQIVAAAYRIIYRVKPNSADILAVLDSRRDVTSLLMLRLLR